MSLTQAQISHLAKLTALAPDTHVTIDSVLDSFDTIAQVDTSDITTIHRSWAQALSLRSDTVEENEMLPWELLHCSPQKVAAQQIVLAGIMHGE